MTQITQPEQHGGSAHAARRPGDGDRWWAIAAVVFSALVAAPVVAVGVLAIRPTDNIWPHLVDTVLPGYVTTTLGLMAGVGLTTFVIGTATAWLITMCKFPGRN